MEYTKFKQIVVSKSNYDRSRKISPNDSFNNIISGLIKKESKEIEK